MLVTYTGLYVPFFYVESYATSIGISGDVAFDMLIIMNAASVIGRLLPPFFADRCISYGTFVPVGCYMLTCAIRQDGKPSNTNPMHLLLGNYNPRLDPGQLTGGIDRHIGHVRLHQR